MHAWQWAVALSFLVVYLIVMLAVPIPSWSYVYGGVTMHIKCDVAGDLTPACSASRWVDVNLMGYVYGYASSASHVWCNRMRERERERE